MVQTSPRVAFGDRLRALRTAAGYSQEGFANHIGLDRSYFGGLERGQRNPTLDVMVKIAAGLGVTVAELVATVEVPSL